MAHVLIMPRQGNTVESCIITNWSVKEGDAVTAETALCEVETDKASFEVPAGAAGTVLKLLYPSGEDVPVLKPIAVIGAPGEDWQAALGESKEFLTPVEKQNDSATKAQDKAPGTTTMDKSSHRGTDTAFANPQAPTHAPQGPVAISPRARNLAAKEAVTVTFSGSGPGGRIIERDVAAALENRPPLTAAAKAASVGVVPEKGSGIGGRITSADVAAVADLASTPSKFSAASPKSLHDPRSLFSSEGAITETPIKGIRKLIASRMYQSLNESAQFTLNASASAVKLKEIHARIKSQSQFAAEHGLIKVSINDLVLFAVSRTLPLFPFMNAHKTGETIKSFERVHLGHAVDTSKGLMVPVIRNASLLSLAHISSEAKRLAAACQNGSALPDELSGSTFTVTNLGGLGITNFTPILNTPEVAILGVCSIELKPIALSEEEANECNDCDCCGIGFEPQIGFSLTIDHQAVDGAPAAKFLKTLCDAVAHIDLLLAAD